MLKSKALDFAAVQQIAPSLFGRDELTFLGRKLCEASAKIRQAEAQRHELISVINHDLRTPLASVLGVLESLSYGVYGAMPEQLLPVIFQRFRFVDGKPLGGHPEGQPALFRLMCNMKWLTQICRRTVLRLMPVSSPSGSVYE